MIDGQVERVSLYLSVFRIFPVFDVTCTLAQLFASSAGEDGNKGAKHGAAEILRTVA
jgi:hypothetical protein